MGNLCNYLDFFRVIHEKERLLELYIHTHNKKGIACKDFF